MNKFKSLSTLPVKIFFIAACLLIGLTTAQHTNAQALPETACDPEFMDALEARAYIEAQREIAQNQNLILKPDSVLEYTCFDKILIDIANGGGLPGTENFSESLVWGGVVGQNALSLDAALSDVLLAAVAWEMGNFSSNLASNATGYSSFLHNRATGVTYDFGETSAIAEASPLGNKSGSYTCTSMNAVWTAAQCMNFMDSLALGDQRDAFHDFDWFVNNDPRETPFSTIGSCADIIGNGPISNDDINIAFNNQAGLYMPNNNPYDDADFYEEDPVVTYLELILPYGTPPPGPGSSCKPPIPTGVTVTRPGNQTQYPDKFCPNPGCHYEPPNSCVAN